MARKTPPAIKQPTNPSMRYQEKKREEEEQKIKKKKNEKKFQQNLKKKKKQTKKLPGKTTHTHKDRRHTIHTNIQHHLYIYRYTCTCI